MAIKIKKSKVLPKKQKIDPYYMLKYEYMIGDANGHTSEEVEISLNNPYLENVIKALNKLKPIKGHWGVVLESNRLEYHYKEKHISKKQYNLLKRIFSPWDEELEDGATKEQEQDLKYITEFHDGIRSDTEYSFLVFEGVKLYYIDENEKEYETEIKSTKRKKKK